MRIGYARCPTPNGPGTPCSPAACQLLRRNVNSEDRRCRIQVAPQKFCYQFATVDRATPYRPPSRAAARRLHRDRLQMGRHRHPPACPHRERHSRSDRRSCPAPGGMRSRKSRSVIGGSAAAVHGAIQASVERTDEHLRGIERRRPDWPDHLERKRVACGRPARAPVIAAQDDPP
jgi:hypothetical protein